MSDDFLKELYLKAYNFPPAGVAKHLAGLQAVRDHYADAAVRDYARPEVAFSEADMLRAMDIVRIWGDSTTNAGCLEILKRNQPQGDR